MKTIHKYPLETIGMQTIEMRVGAVVRHIGMQRLTITLWAEVDPNQILEERLFIIVGTGQPVNDRWQYLGTVFDGPALVWHIYEVVR